MCVSLNWNKRHLYEIDGWSSVSPPWNAQEAPSLRKPRDDEWALGVPWRHLRWISTPIFTWVMNPNISSTHGINWWYICIWIYNTIWYIYIYHHGINTNKHDGIKMFIWFWSTPNFSALEAIVIILWLSHDRAFGFAAWRTWLCRIVG